MFPHYSVSDIIAYKKFINLYILSMIKWELDDQLDPVSLVIFLRLIQRQ